MDETLFKERLNSLLNSSSSKQAYSFGKAIRFRNKIKNDLFFQFYNLPTKRSTRGTILGYGQKCNSILLRSCGSNQLYPAPTFFNIKKYNSPIFPFGVSHKNIIREEDSPGPIYNIGKTFGKGSPSCIFGKANIYKAKTDRKKNIYPGPGYYYNENNHKLSINYSSNLLNSANVIIGKAKRFKIGHKDKTPGPGEYNIPSLINDTGIINYNSKYKSIPARSFLGRRNIFKFRKDDSTPGPGQYSFFSIFEGYSKDKSKKVNE